MQAINDYFHRLINAHAYAFGVFVALFSFVFFAGGLVAANGQSMGPSDSHVVSLYVDGQERILPSRAQTVGDFLKSAGVALSEYDLVEPALTTPIENDNFSIQIYRARPVTIVEGTTQQRVMTPYTTEKLVAEKAGLSVYDEDKLTFSDPDGFVESQILGQKLTIERATPVTISLYGTPAAPYRTHVNTVGELLAEKGIVPEEGATVTPAEDTVLTPNTAIFISKYGKSVTTVEESVAFPVESTPDPTKPNGVVTITKPGVKGKKQVVYELVLRDGKTVSRTKIQEVITQEPQKQLQTLGTKPGSGLSKSKGVVMFTDSKGVMHRETYYDLPMTTVMKNCGAAGYYTVRSDGAKVDKDGYILVAANLNIYPRCSIVETSIGLGKVYDTGGFVLVHPYGFDLATDWSNNNGR